MSLHRQNHKRKERKHLRPSLFGSGPQASSSWGDGRRGLRIEPLEERRLLAVDMVTSNLDDGSAGTLRSVIAAAASGDAIEFNLPRGATHIDLTQGQIEINKDLTIQGPGTGSLSIGLTTSGFVRLFQIDAQDVNSNPVSVSISSLTLTGNSSAQSSFIAGGGIHNLGTLMLEAVTLSGNSARDGGGLFNDPGAQATVIDCTFSNNREAVSPGGGGGIYNAGSLYVDDSTFSGNFGVNGGGIDNTGTATLNGDTLSANFATNGGGILNESSGTLNVANTIAAGNVASGVDNSSSDVVGSFAATDHDLIGIVGDATGFTGASGDAINGNLMGTNTHPLDPKLAPLGNHGGQMPTMDLLPGSPAIDAGDNTPGSPFSATAAADQRGFSRIVGSAVDIGAVESQPLSPTMYVAQSYYDLTTASTTSSPSVGDRVNWLASGQFAEVDNLTFGNNAFSSIQAAVTAATGTQGQVIAVAAGTYNESVNVTQPVLIVGAEGGSNVTCSGVSIDLAGGAFGLEGVTVTSSTGFFGAEIHQTAGITDLIDDVLTNGEPGIFNANQGTLGVLDTTISGNVGGDGGGIANNGVATVTDCTITNNHPGGSSSAGGGVYNSGTMIIADSTISQNTSESSFGGGGVFNQGGTLTIESSLISGNTTDGNGGNGIYNHFGTLTVNGCTISGNSVAPSTFQEADGGGIKNDNGRLFVTNSTITGNSTNGNGGGLESDNGEFLVINSTIAANTAAQSGGGINNFESFGAAIESTIVGNSAGDQAGGVNGVSNDGSSEMFLADTIVAGNLAAGGDPDVSRDFSDIGLFANGPSDHDLIGIVGDATGFVATGANASLIGTAADPIDPKLGALADNGGPTQTMALLPGSPAIDAGNNVPAGFANGMANFGLNPTLAALTTDQRGVTRILNGTVDIGAYEFTRVAASTNGNYTLKLAPDASQGQTQREILDPSNHVVFTSPVNVTPALIFANTGGNTVNLTVDYSAGDPIPAGGLTFNGGGNDSLTVTGYNTSTLTDSYSGAHSGSLLVGTGGPITYSGLAPLTLDGTASSMIVNLPSGAVSATLEDDGTPGNDTSELVSTNGTFEATTFTEPTGSLTVNAGAGGDTITVTRNFTTDFNANLGLIGGAGNDTFNVYATPATGSLTINGGGSVNSNILNDFTPADAEIWSDAGTPPVVTLGSSGEQPINFTSIQQVNVTPGNGVANVYGDDNQPATSQNDGYQVVGTGPNAFKLAISGNNANQASYSQSISFSGVNTLNAYGEAKGTTSAHNDANQLSITPYADNTPQGWGVQTLWNQGNSNGNGLLVYNGVAGVAENITVTPSGSGVGQLTSTFTANGTMVGVINYALNTNLVVNANDGSAGDTDALTLKGTNPGATGSGQFSADFATPGSTGSSLRISDTANGKTLYTLQSTAHLSSLAIVGAGIPSQNTLLVDGYNPVTGLSGTLDTSLTASEDRTSTTSGIVSVSQAAPATTQYPEINYSNVGTLTVNSAAGSSVQGPTISFGSAGVAGSGLEGASDTGVAGQPATLADRITADSTPTFYGTAQVGALVQLYVDMNGNGKIDSGDVLIGQETVPPSGPNGNGEWTIASTVDLNNPKFGFAHDGLRTILATAEDATGDVSSTQVLTILLETQGPHIAGVSVTGMPGYNLFVTEEPTPTPLVNSLDVTFTDPVTRSLLFPAVNPTLATTVANYQLVGRTNGVIPITSVTYADSTLTGNQGQGVATLHFGTPLPDDFYTLTISDAIEDNAGNALDGDFNGSSFPSGNGTPGGSFTGSFVVNSRPHLAVATGGSVSLDINGDGTFGPSNTVPNSDLVESFGYPNDQLFSGKFAGTIGTVSGFDELGAYGNVNGQWRWLLNLNPDQGTSSPTSYAEPLSIKGTTVPVAGYFAGNWALGMQVGLFSSGTWYLDVLNHHTIDAADVAAGGQLKGNMQGTPIVGDFDGDGKTDLATYQKGVFEFDLSSKEPGGKLTGNANASINVTALIPQLNYAGVTAVPVAADLDGDGITDLGLDVTNAASGTGWYWLVSNDSKDAGGVNPAGAFAALNHTFNPAPLGHDLSYQFSGLSGKPLMGIWDPPTSLAGASTSAASGGYVDSLYQTVLGRQPSSSEVGSWNSALASGQVTNAEAAQMFVESSERLGAIISGYYEQYLGRAADPAGLNYWISVWQASGGSEQVQAGIIGSAEYYATAGKLYPNLSADAAWVTALYNNILGRDPDQQGLDFWVNFIQTNSRQSVVLGFVTSAEYRLGLIDGWFEQYLGRPVDPSSGQYLVNLMEQGVTQDQIQVSLLTSNEFVSRSETAS